MPNIECSSCGRNGDDSEFAVSGTDIMQCPACGHTGRPWAVCKRCNNVVEPDQLIEHEIVCKERNR